MKISPKRAMLTLICCSLLASPIFGEASAEEKSDHFGLDPLTDSLLLGGGLLLNIGDIAIESAAEQPGGWGFDASADLLPVNPLDRLFVLPYSEPLKSASGILTYAALLAPAVMLAAPVSEWVTIGTMYAESVIWTWGLKELGKNLIHRNRPYMYFAGFPQDEITSGDFQQSFPSGHTSLAFTGAGFCAFVFSEYFENSPWKAPIIAASYALAIYAAGLRVASGSHFLTDVIAGAVIGTLSGYLVPWLHTQEFSIAILPSGVSVRL